MAKRTVRSVKRSCDLLWARLVKARAGGHCEHCGDEPEIAEAFHAHHVYGRSNHRLRFAPQNGCALCWKCHRWAEETPMEFAPWFQSQRPGDHIWLIRENRKGLIRRDLQAYLDLEFELARELEAVAA